MNRKPSNVPDRHKVLLLLALVLAGLGLWFFSEPFEAKRTSLPIDTPPRAKTEAGGANSIPMHGGRVDEPQPALEKPITSQDSAKETETPPPVPPAAPPSSGPTWQNPPTPGTPKLSPDEFREQADLVLQTLPRQKKLQGLKASEVHSAPAPIREAAVQMGKIADLVAANPEVRPEALAFYQRCSLTPDLAQSLRALCLKRARQFSQQLTGQDWDFDKEKIPEAVQKLSNRL